MMLKGFVMRIFPLVVVSAAMWISVTSCSASPSSSGSGGAGSTSTSTSTGTGGVATPSLIHKVCNDIAGPFCEADWTCCQKPGARFGQNVDDSKKQFVTPGNQILEFCRGPDKGDRADLEASLRAGSTVFDQAQL